MSISSRLCRSSSPKGFTLVELLVVVAVIAIMSGFLLFNQGKFSSGTLLRSLGYSVALTVRQAQVFGTTVRGFGQGSGAATFAPGYGTYFSGADPTHVYLFADLNNNGVMDSSPTDERLSSVSGSGVLTLGRGYSIKQFCAVVNASMQDCYPQGVGGGNTLTDLSIYFKRPLPDACISSSAAPSVCAPGSSAVYSGAYIQVASIGNSDVRSVRVTNTGQIVVCQLGADPLTCGNENCKIEN